MVPMITKDVWIARDEHEIMLFSGKVKPARDENWGGYVQSSFLEFCIAGWKRAFRNLLGLRVNQVKRFRITIEEIPE